MDIKSVLIENEDTTSKSVLSSSAILLRKKYVITTSHILRTIFQQNIKLIDGITAGKLHIHKGKQTFKLRVLWNCDNETNLVSRQANIFALFRCKNIDKFCKHEFKDWKIDFKENNNMKNFISIFLIFALRNETVSEHDLKSTLYTWLLNIYSITLNKGDNIICRSSPFGTRDFLNSLSEGIISNTLYQSHLLLSDCSSAPGSEGGLVYAKHNSTWPLAIVISSLNWWRQEWAGFTLIANVQPIICQMIGLDLVYYNQIQISTINKVLATSVTTLAQINCGTDWGTCILMSKEKGIFLTNSHVVRHGLNIRIIWRNKIMPARLIYKNPDDSIFDLAVIQCKTNLSLMSSCDVSAAPVTIYNPGDAVYCAGYPLLSVHSKPKGVTITRGVISECSPYMIKTTCGVFPGFSGGAVLNSEGMLLGIIVCNTKLTDIDATYPRLNMAVPFKAIFNVIMEYIEKDEGHHVLTKLRSSNPEAVRIWMSLEGKL